jgi:hypothetical protein
MASSNVLLLTGAPAAASLDPSAFLDDFSEPFRTIISSNSSPITSNSLSKTQPSHATWRSLRLNRQPLHTGLTPVHDVDDLPRQAHHRDFFNSASIISSGGENQTSAQGAEDAQDVLTQFYEQSLAIHNPLPSSQLDDTSHAYETTTYLDETSFVTTSSLSNATTTSAQPPPPAIPAHLSDLEDVPTAAQLLSLHPQTITLNIIAGILSIAQPRTVTTRWGKTLSLVEILLGDETRSGFSVTFWLAGDNDAYSKTLHLLQRQDVVLLQNVALHVFRGKVYGQSLRHGQTRVHLLWRRRGSGGCYSNRDLAPAAAAKGEENRNPQVEKTARVKDWVLRFVGAVSRTAGKVEVLKGWDKPPDDTQ